MAAAAAAMAPAAAGLPGEGAEPIGGRPETLKGGIEFQSTPTSSIGTVRISKAELMTPGVLAYVLSLWKAHGAR